MINGTLLLPKPQENKTYEHFQEKTQEMITLSLFERTEIFIFTVQAAEHIIFCVGKWFK